MTINMLFESEPTSSDIEDITKIVVASLLFEKSKKTQTNITKLKK